MRIAKPSRTCVLLTCALAVATAATDAASADRPPVWAPASTATIHPGVQTYTEGTQCTADFVFYDSRSVYLGQAAHCSGFGIDRPAIGGACAVKGIPPLGTRVKIVGASNHGTIVYHSWLTMQRVGETDRDICDTNDFALVRVHESDKRKVNPSIPFWGGPTASGGRSASGDRVYTYGNSMLRVGISALSPKYGVNTTNVHNALSETTRFGRDYGAWVHHVTTVTSGIPGDSGSAVLDASGRGLGILITMSLDGSNGILDLSKALAYMKAKTNLDAIQFAKGTEPFRGLF